MTKNVILFVAAAVAIAALFALDLWVGPVRLGLSDVWRALAGSASEGGSADFIVRNFRLPKALTAVLAGAALGASGLMMQTLFRNPLAGPYVLGVSSGASLGVALFSMGAPLLGAYVNADVGAGVSADVNTYANTYAAVFQNLGSVGAAWIGAGLIFLLIMAASRRIKEIMVILIIGMMLASVAGAVVEVLQYLSPEGAVKSFIIWTMGSLGGVTAGQLTILAPVILVALAGSLAMVKPLDALMAGEDYARTMGVNVGAVRALVFVNTTLLAGTVTAFCGPIGFLGLAVPHIARIVSGRASHRVLMPLAMLLGAAVMLACDILSGLPGRTPLPINTLTALVGIPVIILVVVKNRKFF